jgi:hypothetical protein
MSLSMVLFAEDPEWVRQRERITEAGAALMQKRRDQKEA